MLGRGEVSIYQYNLPPWCLALRGQRLFFNGGAIVSTAIQWTDVTDNIIVVEGGGWWCRKISPGCAHCYAAQLNQNAFFGGNFLQYSGKVPPLVLKEDILARWARQRVARKHFVASMTDVFGEWVLREWIFKFLDAMAAAPRQTFQVLTKRADVMRTQVTAWVNARGLSEVSSHIWLGTSVENQEEADRRIPDLLMTPAQTVFLSCEPLLEALDLSTYLPLIDWVIVGWESGNGARACHTQWIREVVNDCRDAKVACFVKQMGKVSIIKDGKPYHWTNSKGGDPEEWPMDLRVRQFPGHFEQKLETEVFG